MLEKQFRVFELDDKTLEFRSNDGSVVTDSMKAKLEPFKLKCWNQNMILEYDPRTGKLPFRPMARWEVMDNDHKDYVDKIRNAKDYKPEGLKMPDLYWKALVRAVLKGINTIMIGESRNGKTTASMMAAEAFERPFYKFDCGSTQDARATFIGNTRLNEQGTFFEESPFIKAIQTPGAVILLDEITRASHDAFNILMPVLDQSSGVLRLDESGGKTVRVAEGVCFIGTANIGGEYTATRRLDRALRNRFPVKIEMESLTYDDEYHLLQMRFPKVDTGILSKIAKITTTTRQQAAHEDAQIAMGIPTGIALEMASMVQDGFELSEALELQVYTEYDDVGGANSERAKVKQICQQYVGVSTDDKLYNAS